MRIDRKSIVCCCCVRNEMLRLPHWLDYYRALGVDRFLFIDNASDDGTRDFLLSQEDVHLFDAPGSYAESRCGVDWINEVLSNHAVGCWVLTVDADELLVYPLCETVSLRTLTEYLDSSGATALRGFMLDMYSNQPVRLTNYCPGTPFIETCTYFDSDTYHEIGSDGIPVRGGPRHRIFWDGKGRPRPSPVLCKTPLVKWRDGLRYEASTHIINDVWLSEVTGALLHFKFFSDFPLVSEREAERGVHWDGAAQYHSYHAGISQAPDLCAFHAGSVRYQDSLQLAGLGLICMPGDYKHFYTVSTEAE